jgi:hypothetical protein
MEKILNKPFKFFRSVGAPLKDKDELIKSTFSKRYDEPTYLTFKLDFVSGSKNIPANNTQSTSFDRMPNPLLDTSHIEKNADDIIIDREFYSTYQYLRDQNELARAEMLKDFIIKWKSLNEEFQYYFQKVSGLQQLFSVDPTKGMRSNNFTIKITMLEGVDLRVSYLLNLYRKIAWDDDYQRWILPDVMRFFQLKIYINEFRNFHTPVILDQKYTTGNISTIVPKPEEIMFLRNFNKVPTYVLELNQCEIDITSLKSVVPDSVGVDKEEEPKVEFSIKVGNFEESYINPFLDRLYSDIIVNGLRYRSKNIDEKNTIKSSTNTFKYELPTAYSEAIRDFPLPEDRFPGTSYLEVVDNLTNSSIIVDGRAIKTNDITPSGNLEPKNMISSNGLDSEAYNQDLSTINPIEPNTWIGNTFTLGKAMAKNFVKDGINKLKMTNIPKVNFSFNEALSAIQSKNVFTVFGLVRKAMEDSYKEIMPSEELDDNMIDTNFREFLKIVVDSKATTASDEQLVAAANLVLNDEGYWDKIKDFSYATDMIAENLGEINIKNEIENKNVYKLQEYEAGINDEIEDLYIFENIPSSKATNNKLS